MSDDIIRVLRIYEFVGPRSQVEQQVARSLHGTKYVRDWRKGSEIVIRAVTVPGYPEILSTPPEQPVTAETAVAGEVPDIVGPEVDDKEMRRQRRQRGAVLLEFALTLPVLLFLLLAGADLLWFEQQAVTLSYVATQAAVCQAQAAPACNPSAWAKTVAAGLLLDPSAMEVTTDAATKSVTIRYDARALTGFLRPMVMTRMAVTP